ncbi:MAG: transglycosylase SLT domain-containing protein [Caulobacteraceae bacterium]
MMAHTAPPAVPVAISRAAEAAHVDLSFLFFEADRESAFNPQARARASSAAGLFQFVDQTWLAELKRHGARFGYARYAELIRQGSDGRYFVPGPEARAAVMALRNDPRAASLMAAEMAADHARWLKARMGRSPSAGELYAAHFLGPMGAADLLEWASETPGLEAAALFPEAARANPAIFRRDGRPATLAEVRDELTGERTSPAEGGAFARYAAARRAEAALAQRRIYQEVLARQTRTRPNG